MIKYKLTENEVYSQFFSFEVLDYYDSIATDENFEWIEKYFEILLNSLNVNSLKYRKHHIIPCFVFKDGNHKLRKETLPIADAINNNLIKLSVYNHIIAHYYLWKIIKSEDSRKAIYMMCAKRNIICLSENEIKEFAKIQEECAKENMTKEQRKEYVLKYRQSEHGKKKISEWQHSEKGKASHKKSREKYFKTENGIKNLKKGKIKYAKSEKGKKKKQEWVKSDEGKESHKKASSKYSQSEKGKKKKQEWLNSDKGKEKFNATQTKYRKSEKGKSTRKAYNSQKCIDPINGKVCTYHALQSRKSRNKELYKDVIPSACII